MTGHDDIRERLAMLEQEVVQLRSELADERDDQPASRRTMLKKVAIAGAGAAAGAIALGSKPAAAADGDHLAVGQQTTAQTNTVLYYDAATTPPPGRGILKVVDSLVDANNSVYPAAVNGWAYGRVQSGVFGYTTSTGYAVVGWSNSASSVGILARGSSRANLELQSEGAAGPARAQAHNRGEIVCDASGDVWLCVVAGNPGTWRKLGGPASAGQVHLLAAPVRVYDARPGEPPIIDPKTPLVPNTPRTIDATGNSSGVPATAAGVLIGLTVANGVSPGYLTAWPQGAWPGTSNINFATNQIVAVSTVTACGPSATFQVQSNVAVDVIVDVVGYYQ